MLVWSVEMMEPALLQLLQDSVLDVPPASTNPGNCNTMHIHTSRRRSTKHNHLLQCLTNCTAVVMVLSLPSLSTLRKTWPWFLEVSQAYPITAEVFKFLRQSTKFAFHTLWDSEWASVSIAWFMWLGARKADLAAPRVSLFKAPVTVQPNWAHVGRYENGYMETVELHSPLLYRIYVCSMSTIQVLWLIARCPFISLR